MRNTLLAAGLWTLCALPVHAQSLSELLRFETSAARIWDAVRRSTPRDFWKCKYGYPAENEASVDGAFFRAGYYGDGKQLQIELPGENGMKLSRVVNFGPNASLRDASVTRRWADGTMLMTLKIPGKRPKHILIPTHGGSREVSPAEARQVIRANGAFRPLQTAGIKSMLQKIRR
jgi:hypothetical protein